MRFSGRLKLRVELAKLGLKLLHRYWKPGVLKVQGLTIKRCPQVFIPGRLTMTSLLLAEALDVREGFEVLDVGCGSGILSLVAARRARRVVAVDINPKALQCTIYNAKVNGLEGKIEARLGSLFQPLKPGEKFDLIVANLPYLPGRPQSLLEAGWLDDGSLILKLLREASQWLKPGGLLQMAYSTLGSLAGKEILEAASEGGLKLLKVERRRWLFETFEIYKFTPSR